jgi:hypothetical protein
VIAAAMAMETSKENFAEQKKAESLPERNDVPSEDGRNQNIPQAFDDKAEHNARGNDEKRDPYSFKHSMRTHGQTPYFFE